MRRGKRLQFRFLPRILKGLSLAHTLTRWENDPLSTLSGGKRGSFLRSMCAGASFVSGWKERRRKKRSSSPFFSFLRAQISFFPCQLHLRGCKSTKIPYVGGYEGAVIHAMSIINLHQRTKNLDKCFIFTRLILLCLLVLLLRSGFEFISGGQGWCWSIHSKIFSFLPRILRHRERDPCRKRFPNRPRSTPLNSEENRFSSSQFSTTFPAQIPLRVLGV